MLAVVLASGPAEVPAVSPTAVVWQDVPKWIKDLGKCIRRHESRGNYRAENPVSSASGAYQQLKAHWQGNAKWVRVAKPWAKKEAKDAPAYVQDAVFIHAIRQGGIKAWHGTGCKGT